jgi:putative FmdB family regulatory protein
MPTYGYRCSNCGHQFEIRQSFSDEPLKVCPKCQGKLTKMVYPTGVIFKGSGFYTTDYKNPAKAADSNGSTSADNNGSKPSSDPKPETKPDTKSEPKSESKSESTD